MPRPKPLVLIILDGWGISEKREANAIALARPAFFESLLKDYPNTILDVAGEAVGLPAGQMGNSEVGHLNIGAGRVVYQELTRINKAIREGSFNTNPALIKNLRSIQSGTLHLIGLVSDGGVHSHIQHLFNLVERAKAEGLSRVAVHVLLDGRDTPPKSGIEYVSQLEAKLSELNIGAIATVMGRYYGMDRDNRWDRVQKAYDAMVLGEGPRVPSALEAIRKGYSSGVTDEFLSPAVIVDEAGQLVGRIQDGDGVIFYNFRADRARELTQALAINDFTGFQRKVVPNLASFLCMTSYNERYNLPTMFSPVRLNAILGQVLSGHG